ncbi:family 78 glycoside hydrolase catalytic domain [Actinoplanes sp. NBRC 103695]|uniref:family 78 glycoside hydrolase catalytic domain n=1 Tax=Actinoplanes sp. NBRC 103695 TaxID=3032202 RepID=UPI0024A282B1|nr:family 78 glycoside hydrolase catalytic domain [Actinoplanes sp. NBRC 103695]GLY93797.1 hydrolase [Actinoplanes sp. NBRC 103695]
MASRAALVVVAVAALLLTSSPPASAQQAGVAGLSVEHRTDPLGVDIARPRLGWILSTRGKPQSAYEIEVSKTRNGPADVWDSGRVVSAKSFDVDYAGPALASRTRYFWRVRVWAGGQASGWSRPGWFETAFLRPEQFQGDWIGAHRTAPALSFEGASWIWHPEGDAASSVPAGTRYFRRTFDLPAGASELQVTADDAFTLYVNGREAVRSPAVADAWRTASIVDVSALLRPGANVIAVVAVNTNAGPAGLLVKLEDLVTDGRWKSADAAAPGWEQPGFDDTAWPAARVAAAYGSGPWGSSVSAPPPPETLLRNEFAVTKPVASARAYISGLGYNKLFLNGGRIGDHELDPGFTVYDKTVLYSTYDVTAALRGGTNAIGVGLGRGFHSMTNPDEWKASAWWGEPRLKLELDITYRDGTSHRVLSGDDWTVAGGPTRSESLWFGETYDARLERPGWDRPGFDDTGWTPALLVDGPGGTLRPQTFPPIKVTEPLAVAGVTEPVAGAHVYDFGSPTAGWARIGVRGPAGATVRITYGEKLRADGTVDNVGGFGMRLQAYAYTLKGDGLELYQPSYSYAGFRYAQIDAPPGVTLESVYGVRVHTAVATTGGFTSSSDLLNRYQDAQRNTILNNLHSIPTDTPMYEKRPYTADGHLYADSAIAHFDMREFYRNWMRSHRDDQNADGSLGTTEPTTESGRAVKDPIWSASFVLVNWDLYWYYGDTGAIAENYDAMKAWLGYYERTIAATGNIYTGFSYGDWLSPGFAFAPEGTRLAGTAYLHLTATKLARMARALGHDADARHFEALAATIADAFNAAFLDRSAGVYVDDRSAGYRQTSNLLPLSLGIVPEADRARVVANLVADVEQRGAHLNTGALGTKLLLPVLTDTGHADLAYRVATNPTYPGWGYWFEELGATTMWEEWGASARSHDHAFLGTVDDWLYQRVAGIEPAAPGYTAVTVKPTLAGDLSSASAHVGTPLGEVSSSWTRTRNRFTLRAGVPGGATATVFVPAHARREVTAPAGARFAGMSGGHATFTVGPGKHVFVALPD